MIGVLVPIAVAISMGHPTAGVLGALGALYAGVAAYGGVYHTRLRVMVGSALATCTMAALGTWVGRNHVVSIVAVVLCGFVVSLYAASSQTASTLGVQACAVMVVFTGLGLPPETALANGAIVLSGAAIQILMLSVTHPFDPSHPERTAVADAIDSLSKFVADVRSSGGQPLHIPASQPFQDARAILDQAEGHHWRAEHDHLLGVIKRAEPVRAALVGWARAHEAYSGSSEAAATRARRIATSLSRSLHDVAGIIRNRTGSARAIRVPVIDTEDPTAADYAHWVEILAGLTADLKRAAAAEAIEVPAQQEAKRPHRSIFSVLTELPDVPSVRTLSFHHAIRYAATLGLAVLLSRTVGASHAYWLPLTVALVLRTDYASTFTRGIGRIAGTLAGVVLSSLLIDLFHPSATVLVLLVAVASWFAFTLFQTGYAAYSVAVTVYVVFSVSAAGLAPREVGIIRVASTICGVLLALSAYVVWPTLHWKQFWQVFRDALAANIAYAEAVTQGTGIDEARVKARGLRLQTENLLHTASVDPLFRGSREMGEAASATHRFDEIAAEMLTIEAARSSGSPKALAGLPALIQSSRNLASEVDEHLR